MHSYLDNTPLQIQNESHVYTVSPLFILCFSFSQIKMDFFDDDVEWYNMHAK